MSHWPCVKRLAHTVGLSAIQALKCEREESETLTAMAGLSMQPPTRYFELLSLHFSYFIYSIVSRSQKLSVKRGLRRAHGTR